MAAAADRAERGACRGIAGGRRAALGARVRCEVDRHGLHVDGRQRAHHRVHRRGLALAAHVLLQRDDQVAGLLPGQARDAGRGAVAVHAVALGAVRGARLAPFVGRGERDVLGLRQALGGKAGVVGRDVAELGLAHALGDDLQRGVRALAFLVGLQRGEQVALVLRGEVRHARRDAAAVQAVAALALGLGELLPGLDVAGHRRRRRFDRRGLRGLLLAAPGERHCACKTGQKSVHRNPRCRFSPRRPDRAPFARRWRPAAARTTSGTWRRTTCRRTTGR